MIISTQPYGTMWFCVWTTKWNDVNWFVLKNILTYLCATSASYCTWYSLLVHLRLPACYFYFTWSITCAALDKCFWNYWAKLKTSVGVAECITVYVSYIFVPVSCTVNINWNKTFFQWYWVHKTLLCHLLVHWYHIQ